MHRHYFKLLNIILLVVIFTSCSSKEKEQADTVEDSINSSPNIVIIYLDDLGYGDVSAYGQQTLVTPNIDALANGGIRFTDGHATSATCTPSRYALLTGRYPWRNTRAAILPGTAPLIIDTAQITLPKMLQSAGYHTALVGKWHLGLGAGTVNWNKRVSPGPNEVGFDYAYYLAATQDRVPTVYLHNGAVVNLDPKDPIEVNYSENFPGEPTALSNPELLTMKWHHGHNNSVINGIPRIGFMKGGDQAKWSDVDMADHFLEKATHYVKEHKDGPFFLYYAMQQPHVPRTPHPRFEGKSGLGPRGDVILEADWAIGEFMATLDQEGILENTLVILTSDNGPVLNDGYFDEAVELAGDHQQNGPLRGGKYSLFEAGARVPFITYWKGEIIPGVSEALVCQMDFLASLAELVGVEVSSGDSQNTLDAFLGKNPVGRNQLIIEASKKTALRRENWLLIPPYPGHNQILKTVNIELGNAEEAQLYNLEKDLGQRENLAERLPEETARLMELYTTITSDENRK